MNLNQAQIQTQTREKMSPDEIIAEIIEAYFNDRTWREVMEILPTLKTAPLESIGVKLCNCLIDGAGNRALAERCCYDDGEKMIRYKFHSGNVVWKCPKCGEEIPEVELNN